MHTKMTNSKSLKGPLAIGSKLLPTRSLCSETTLYKQIVGALQYLALTRKDIAFVVNFVIQFMQQPYDAHW